jgi:transposase
MLSSANLKALEAYGKKETTGDSQMEEKLQEFSLSYIVGARIKSMSHAIERKILDLESYEPLDEDRRVKEFTLEDGRRLIVTHSRKRARKDQAQRQEAIEKLREKLHKDSSFKSKLSNNGYRKFLKVDSKSQKEKSSCKITITLDEEKIEADSRFDGLKGLITNDSKLSKEEIIDQYANLWVVEESFRINKHDLRIRPIFHFKQNRIKAHIAICFMAYTLVRHLEYRIRLLYKKLSVRRIKQLLLSVQVSLLQDTKTQRKYLFPSSYEEEVKKIYKIMGVELRNRAVLIQE